MVQRHNVVIPKPDGGVEMYPMKEWLRQHPDQIPPGLNPSTSTSHQLRNALKKLGWTIRDTPTEVLVVKPGGTEPDAVIEQVLGSETDDEDTGTPDVSFSLEYQLRDFLAQNLSALSVGGRRLRLYVDPAGKDGVEYPTGVGPIDILAVDDAGNFFVFELKRAASPDHAVGQLARYMGWVKQTIGRGRDVHGVIVAKAISEKLRYAVSVVPKVSVFEYEVEFHLKPAHDLPLQV